MDITRAESVPCVIEIKRDVSRGGIVEKRRKCGVRFAIGRVTINRSSVRTEIE
jgi:hypothetical protein